MLIGIGTDILRISRIPLECPPENDPLLRSYTAAEQAESCSREVRLTYFATRFAGKEAVYKAISGCGKEFRPADIEIVNDTDGRPCVRLLGETKAAFERYAGDRYTLFISLSYDTDYAGAFAIAEKL